MLPLGSVVSPELVIGLVGRIVLDTRLVSRVIREILAQYHYKVHHIKVTSSVPKLEQLPENKDPPLEDCHDSRIPACNKPREISGRNDPLACPAVTEIRAFRSKEPGGSPDTPARRTARVTEP